MKGVRAVLFFLVGMICFAPRSFAHGDSNSSDKTLGTLKTIDIGFTTLGGLSYSVDGVFLTNYKSFEELITPLRDFEASRLLKKSESADVEAKLFGLVGVGGLVTGLVGLLTSPSNQQTPFWVTGVGGAVLFNIGGLFHSEAQTTKFNCAQRYNRFARGEEQILPPGPENEKSLLDFGHKAGNVK